MNDIDTVTNWLNSAVDIAINNGFTRDNKRRIYELINLAEVLKGNLTDGKVKRAYNFLITLRETEEVAEIKRRVER